MTPERARELWNHQTTARSPMGGAWIGRTLELGDIRKHMTAEEDHEIRTLWATMPGWACYADALRRIANPQPEESDL